ncbi:MAG: hypothetical protein GKR88_10960 [Flavobacteriaceae bacterium]|nr:MAG: hypothetical protein GKR88_10960 [Flavobacteriaceae bacterium]
MKGFMEKRRDEYAVQDTRSGDSRQLSQDQDSPAKVTGFRRLDSSEDVSSESGVDRTVDNTELSRQTTLAEIAMLGSHDSGTYNVERHKPVSVCQHLDLTEQAKHGVQYFDLRVRKSDDSDWQFYHGEKKWFMAGYNATGSATRELSKLFDFAKQNPRQLFIFKFHFDKHTNDSDEIGNFLQQEVVEKLKDNLIPNREGTGLGEVTLENSVYRGKNIGILAHYAEKSIEENSTLKEYVYKYKENTRGGWGNTPKDQELIQHITKNIAEDSGEGKRGRILTSQTNLPAFVPNVHKAIFMPKTYRGLEHLAAKSHANVAQGVERAITDDEGNVVRNPGVMSMDFVGTEAASTDYYAELRDKANALKKKEIETTRL